MFYGQTSCQETYKSGPKSGQNCNNQAYYQQDNEYLCGVHSNKEERKKLPKDPDAGEKKEAELKRREELVKKLRKKGKGDIICTKLKMMKAPEHIDGYLKVFPNYKHNNRKDGFGCSALSPKSLGPINHNEKDVPVALNLENYHQFSKVFSCEVGASGNPKEEFYKKRNEAYEDEIPHRHKFKREELKNITDNVNIPLYAIHIIDGKERRYTYIESRYFYCHYYELLAKETKEYKKLVKKLNKGTSLQIIGYDAYPVARDLMECYLDDSKPFGHELVLYSLLTIENSNDYPWNKYYKEHKTLYT